MASQIKTYVKYYDYILTLNTSKLTIKKSDRSDVIDKKPKFNSK